MKLNRLTNAVRIATVAMALGLTGCELEGSDGIAGVAGKDGANGKDGAGQVISLERMGRTASRGFAVSAAEIVDYDKKRNQIMVVNANSGQVDVFSDITASTPTLTSSLDMATMLFDANIVTDKNLVGAANSIAVFNDTAAVAVQAKTKTDTGWVVLLNLVNLSLQKAVVVGALPDMVTFTPDGSLVLVANEGEPSEDYSQDPEGSISVIDLANNYAVKTIGFTDFNTDGNRHNQLPTTKMILDGFSTSNTDNKATVAQSFEPEYIAVASDGQKAFVSLQENNAIVVVDLTTKTIEKIIGLGFKNHALVGNEMDASQKDGVNLKNWPVMGAYMPDSISTFEFNGKTFLLTANEGDSREDWLNQVTDKAKCEAAGYYFKSKCRDELALRDLADSDLTLASTLTGLDTDSTLGRLKFSYHTTKVMNKGTNIKELYAYGGRSFSIYDTDSGLQVFDSGSDFERLTAQKYAADFNNDNDVNEGDGRSDNKGPEPEAITVGKVNGHTYAFIGLERMGGVMTYDISNPYAPEYVQYINDRDLTVSPSASTDAGDLGPEGFKFVSASNSPNSKPYLIVGNEVSGTTSIYEIKTSALTE